MPRSRAKPRSLSSPLFIRTDTSVINFCLSPVNIGNDFCSDDFKVK